MALIGADGKKVLSPEEQKARISEMMKVTTDDGLKQLLQVTTLHEAHMLWFSGVVSPEQLTAFLMLGIAVDLKVLVESLGMLKMQVMPRPGGGVQ